MSPSQGSAPELLSLALTLGITDGIDGVADTLACVSPWSKGFVMRARIFSTLLLALSFEPAMSPARADLAPPPRRDLIVIAELGSIGALKCDGDKETWSNLIPTAGLTPLVTNESVRKTWLDSVGAMVRFTGRISTELPSLPLFPEPCMPMQMRSDWLYTPSGIVIDKAGLNYGSPLDASTFEVWDGLSMERKGDKIQASLTNKGFDRPLKDITLVAHYEGCYGKPGSTSRNAKSFDLAQKATKTVEFPALLSDADKPVSPRHRPHYRLVSVQVRSAMDDVVFLLDRSLYKHGIDIDCEENREK